MSRAATGTTMIDAESQKAAVTSEQAEQPGWSKSLLIRWIAAIVLGSVVLHGALDLRAVAEVIITNLKIDPTYRPTAAAISDEPVPPARKVVEPTAALQSSD